MNLFNFDRIVTENFDLKDYIQRTQADEVFLHTTLNTLSKLNESVNGSIKKLYTSVLEADSKAEENKYFCETFKEFKEVVCNFISDMNVMLGRFSIELDNIVDANKDLLEDDNYITNYNGGCVVNATKYKNLNSDFPKVDPILVYKKEFDKIGTLMQDIGNLASNEVKLKVIVSVYNDFAKDLNTGWNEKIISSIVGDGATSDNYAEALYNLYREGSKEVEITKSLLFSAKNCLLGYKQYVSLTTSSIQSILDEFEKIALDVESMVFRNEDNKLRIDTPTDGVENRDYQLDVYSTNQLNIFMKAKIAQITQLCNLYSIAISMKLDAIKEYVNQNKNILQCVKYNCSECDNEEPNLDEDIENITSDDELTDDTSIEDHTEEKDSEEELDDGHDDFYDNDDNQEDQEQEEDDDKEDMSDESSDDFYDNKPSSAVQADDEINDKETVDVRDSMDEIEYESYIFDYHLFSLDRILEQEEIMDALRESMILEEEGTSGDNNSSQENKDPGKDLNKDLLNGKGIDIINYLLAAIEKLWKKFEESFIINSKSKANNLKSKKDYIIGGNCKYKSLQDIADKQNAEGIDILKITQHTDPNGVSEEFSKLHDFDVTVDNIGNEDIINKYKDEISYFTTVYDVKDDMKLKNSGGDNNEQFKPINVYLQEKIISGPDTVYTEKSGDNAIDQDSMIVKSIGDAYKWCTEGYTTQIQKLQSYHNAIMSLKGKLSVVCKNFDNQVNNSNNTTDNKQQDNNSTTNNQDSNSNDQTTTKQESYSLKSTKEEYFNEFSGGGVPESVKKQNASGGKTGQFKKMLKVYISANSKILSGQMSGLHKVYNEYYSILKYVAKYNGDTSQDDTNKQNDQQQDNNK